MNDHSTSVWHPTSLDPTSITTPAKMPDDLVGELLHGRYRVTELIASGGQACVYKAEDTLHFSGAFPARWLLDWFP